MQSFSLQFPDIDVNLVFFFISEIKCPFYGGPDLLISANMSADLNENRHLEWLMGRAEWFKNYTRKIENFKLRSCYQKQHFSCNIVSRI